MAAVTNREPFCRVSKSPYSTMRTEALVRHSRLLAHSPVGLTAAVPSGAPSPVLPPFTSGGLPSSNEFGAAGTTRRSGRQPRRPPSTLTRLVWARLTRHCRAPG